MFASRLPLCTLFAHAKQDAEAYGSESKSVAQTMSGLWTELVLRVNQLN